MGFNSAFKGLKVIKMNNSTKVPIRLYELALDTGYKELAKKKGRKRTCNSANAKGLKKNFEIMTKLIDFLEK